MTALAKEEIELMVDKVAELTSELNDYQTEEEDEVDPEVMFLVELKLARFNIKELKLAQHHLDKAKQCLLNLAKQN